MAKEKRANGEGGFSRLPSGKVRYQVYIDDKRKSFTGKTEADCRRQYKDFLINRSTNALNSTTTLKAWIATYLETYRKGTMKSSSYHQLELLKDKIPDGLMKKKVSEIKPAEVQMFLNGFAETASESYIGKMYSLLRSCFAQAVENDLALKDPTRKLKANHKPEKQKEIYSLVQAQKIIEYARSYNPSTKNKRDNRAQRQIAAGICVLLIAGSRRGELLGLTYNDLDVDAGVIHIRRAVYTDNNIPCVKEGEAKTPGSIRDVPVPRWLLDMVLSIPKTGLYPFGTSIGSLMCPRNFNRAYDRFIESIEGIDRQPVHSCRHTCATLMQTAGVDIRDVQLYLGHTKIETTAKYTHPDIEKLRAASEKYAETVAHALHTA